MQNFAFFIIKAIIFVAMLVLVIILISSAYTISIDDANYRVNMFSERIINEISDDGLLIKPLTNETLLHAITEHNASVRLVAIRIDTHNDTLYYNKERFLEYYPLVSIERSFYSMRTVQRVVFDEERVIPMNITVVYRR